ncbi:MAG: hypothetical protein ABIJ61_09645 [bacterium]
MSTLDYATRPVLVLTVDTDWSPQTCVEDTLELLREHEAPATIFATRGLDPRLLHGFDVGLHPNFCGPTQSEEAILEELRACSRSLPRATGVRSHALVGSSRHYLLLRDKFGRLRYTSNCYMPGVAGIMPFTTQSGLPELPIYWMDHLALENGAGIDTAGLLKSMLSPGLKVLDFHPFHVYINSQSRAHFQTARPCYHNVTRLSRHRRNGAGVRTFLSELLQRAKEENLQLTTCAEVAKVVRQRIITSRVA